jgi:hypothetical protein
MARKIRGRMLRGGEERLHPAFGLLIGAVPPLFGPLPGLLALGAGVGMLFSPKTRAAGAVALGTTLIEGIGMVLLGYYVIKKIAHLPADQQNAAKDAVQREMARMQQEAAVQRALPPPLQPMRGATMYGVSYGV